jgi:hypothetical protein
LIDNSNVVHAGFGWGVLEFARIFNFCYNRNHGFSAEELIWSERLMQVVAVGRNEIPPCPMPARFRTDIAYFMATDDQPALPRLPLGEYRIDLTSAERWLADGVVEVVSPLDSLKHTEFEITEEQEVWLAWLVQHRVEHVRLQD